VVEGQARCKRWGGGTIALRGRFWDVIGIWHLMKTFTLRKRIIRIMVGAHSRTSCRRLFKKLAILTVPSQYIYSLMSFFIGNQENFLTNSSVQTLIQEINTIFIDQLQTCLVFRKVHPTLGSEFLTAYQEVLQVLRMKRSSLK
jgi:hypothetical protein